MRYGVFGSLPNIGGSSVSLLGPSADLSNSRRSSPGVGTSSRSSSHDRGVGSSRGDLGVGPSSDPRVVGSSSRDYRYSNPAHYSTLGYPGPVSDDPYPPGGYSSSLGKYEPRNRRQSLHGELKKLSLGDEDSDSDEKEEEKEEK